MTFASGSRKYDVDNGDASDVSSLVVVVMTINHGRLKFSSNMRNFTNHIIDCAVRLSAQLRENTR